MAETTLFTPKKSTTPFRLTAKDIETVRALNRYFLLSAEQVRRLFYGKGSITWAKDRLRLLTKYEYASVLDNKAKGEYVYRLGPEGLKLCRKLDEPVPRRLRLYQSSDSEYYVPHTLAINDVLISADLLARTQQAVTVLDLIHEKQMAAIKVPVGGGRMEGVITDGILTFSIVEGGEKFEQTFFLEIDMGYRRTRWMTKVCRLISYGKEAYKKHYDTPFFTVAVITPLGEAHLRNLKRWTEDVFTEDGLRGTAIEKSFVFTAAPAATIHPASFWLGTSWLEPFSDIPLRLIETPGTAAPDKSPE
jgi:hypothetical protein